ncbi:hypothetical protein JOF56_009271 [Kibdelosporangium banguiense]|uniref:Uncharacterized protein n=1 Tax=Kibdelosporangium banguiense TaxID=1365924 RepID=A0ABS4TY70_9PSEU|nr:hypothetical protein [Kibdelosporangium banguiense]MBP2328886.1 hypothetical protein [Kibdelosporangium banguiense]
MDGRIGSLHCEYLVSQREDAEALDQIARTTLPGALDTALTALAGIGEAVYVCRDVRSDCVLDPHAPDLARRWAEALAGSISRAIGDNRHDQVNVMRFADQADYTARYLADHVHGRAAGRWYYRPLARSGHRPSDVAVLDAIRGPSAGEVLAALHRQGTLPDVLSVLDDAALAAVAEQALLPVEQTSATGDPLLTAAIQIASSCALWTDEAVVPKDIVVEVRDWRSPTALTEAVIDALRQLEHRGLLRRSGAVLPDEVRPEFGWLDLTRIDQWLSVPDVPLAPDAVILAQERRPIFPAALFVWPPSAVEQPGIAELVHFAAALNLAFPGETAQPSRRPSAANLLDHHLSTMAGQFARATASLDRTPLLLGSAPTLAAEGHDWTNPHTATPEAADRQPPTQTTTSPNLTLPGETTQPSRRLPPVNLLDHWLSTMANQLIKTATNLGGTPVLLGFNTAPTTERPNPHITPEAEPSRLLLPGRSGQRPDTGTRSHSGGPAFSAGPGFPLLDTGSVLRTHESVLAGWRIAMADRLGRVPVELGPATTSTPAPESDVMRHLPADVGSGVELSGAQIPATATPVGTPPQTQPGGLGGNLAKVRMVVHHLLTTAPGAVELGQRIGAAGPGPYSTVLLTAALFAEHPEWTNEPAVSEVITEAMAAWRDPDRVTEFGDLARVLAMTAVSTPEEVVTSPNAGVLLLLRSVADLRLPALLTRAGFATGLSATLLTVAARLTGANPSDPAAHVFAGLPEQPLDVLLDVWRQADDDRCAMVRDEVISAARAQRFTLDSDPAAELPDGLLGVPSADATIGLVSVAVLRAWSRWLGQFAGSSLGYLVGHFLCRAGTVHLTEDEIVVELTGGPLDVVLQLAGYDAPIATVPWLGGRSVTYRIGAR